MSDVPYWSYVFDYISRLECGSGDSTLLVDCSGQPKSPQFDMSLVADELGSSVNRCVAIGQHLSEADSKTTLAALKESLDGRDIDIELWDLDSIKKAVATCRSLALHVFPQTVPNADSLIEEFDCITDDYREKFREVHNQVRFVGMSVYKEEATSGIPLDKLYIPLRVIKEDTQDEDTADRIDPITLLNPGSRHVILGDPGSGKSTLMKFLSLVGWHEALQERFQREADQRIPVLIVLRQYADELKSRPELSILEYAAERACKELGMPDVTKEFLEYHLCIGNGILLLDGVDELPSLEFKKVVRERVSDLLQQWPHNNVLVTSRIVGYEKDARFSGAGFSHYKVARLLPEDVSRFVQIWYEERITGDLEREDHVSDLSGILDDEQNHAIRDLAANPLLLTIICLVHRVDGTLPDERVVLYHKCTETLLNTWHSWKFRSSDKLARSATESRNRARMEFIAFCMHGLLDSTDENQRAVVPLDDLHSLLVDYIIEEEPHVVDGEKEALLFLRFVRERAGLLIEVGDGEFSFVHLTFQEYLAATYLRMAMEAVPEDPDADVGIHAVWRLVEASNRHANPRWHETIRLLIASLKRIDAQRYLVKKIIPGDSVSPDEYQARSLLAGGVLLDQVEGAVALAGEIIERLLRCCIVADDDEVFAKPFQLLSRICERCPTANENLAEQIKHLSHSVVKDDRLRLGLVLASLGWDDSRIAEHLPNWLPDDVSGFFSAFLATDRVPSESRFRFARNVAFAEMIDGKNTTAMSIVWGLCEEPQLPHQALLGWICFLHAERYFETLNDWYSWVLSFQSDDGRSSSSRYYRDRAGPRTLHASLRPWAGVAGFGAWTIDLTWDRISNRIWGPNRDRVQARGRARAWARAWAPDPNLELPLTLTLPRVRDPKLSFWFFDMDKDPERVIRLAIFGTVEAVEDPRWWQALQTRRLNQLKIVSPLPDPVANVSLATLSSELVGQQRIDRIATWLLFDIAMYWGGEHDNQESSPFATLAAETATDDSALLKIVHCIRDLAYGDESRTDDLEAMVKSDDPRYQQIFREAYWID